jgi:hypothetical protein
MILEKTKKFEANMAEHFAKIWAYEMINGNNSASNHLAIPYILNG